LPLISEFSLARPTSNPSAAELFTPVPNRWGLRGDPSLWEALRQSLRATPMPISERKLRKLLEHQIERLCGRPLATIDQLSVAEFDRGGMSGGIVCGPYWRDTALPLLHERHRQWLIARRQPRRAFYLRMGVIVLIALGVLLGFWANLNNSDGRSDLPAERLPAEGD
jgi:molybdenum cofactor cytidylyltransferase